MRHIKIFVSSPGDVGDERAIALKLIEQLGYDSDLSQHVTLESVAWDKKGADVPMLATHTPQEAVDQGLPMPQDCDIVIVIFWQRMGTPLPTDRLKPDGSRYWSGTEWEFENAVAAARTCQTQPSVPQVLVYRRKGVSLNPDDDEFAVKLEQYERVKTFFDAFNNPDGSIQQGYNSYETPEEFREKLDTHLQAIIKRLLASAVAFGTDQDQPFALPTWEGSPFPGLRPFTPADAQIFFGRGHEADRLVDLVRDQRFVVVVGTSGSGKSSLVWAGLIPRLRANAIDGSRDWVDVRFTPGEFGDNPFMALADRLRAQTTVSAEWSSNPKLAALLSEHPDALDRVADQALVNKPGWARLLLFVDQFEELFTLVAERYRQPLIDLLAYPAPRVQIVATMRADFYYRFVEVGILTELLRAGTYPLSTPGVGALHEMITRPADRARLTFDEGLPERILNDTGTDPGALALMAFALDELYQRSAASRQLTTTSYELLGGVQGAIGTRATAIFDRLDPQAQAALPVVFQELIEIDERGIPTRRRALLLRFAHNEAALRLIEELTAARLLTRGQGEENEPVVEVAHEALLRRWRRLTHWINETSEDLRLLHAVRVATQEWDQQERDQDYLWSPGRLVEVHHMISRLQPELSAATRDFISSEFDRLMDELRQPETSPQRRKEIGDTLAILGDTRAGVGVGPEGLPDIAWCDVTPDAGDSFKIARYPVTVGQYQVFLGADDSRSSAERSTPPVNYPMTGITWDEAQAFCHWLSAQTGAAVRLPSPAEWTAAASAPHPWGDEWDLHYANTAESELNQPVAVGMYPAGESPSGALDMGGNVFEWCSGSGGARVGSRSDSMRSISGGSFRRTYHDTWTSEAFQTDSELRSPDVGFRPVIGPPLAQEAEPAPPVSQPAAAAIDQPITQMQQPPWWRRFAWTQQLPVLRVPRGAEDYRLLDIEQLDRVLQDFSPAIIDRIRDDIKFLDQELMHLFREHDYEAKVNQNRHRLFQLGYIILAMLVALTGVLAATLIDRNPQYIQLAALLGTVVALSAVFLGTVSRNGLPPVEVWLDARRRAEALRREYFRFLLDLPPYDRAHPANRQMALAMRVAEINHGNLPTRDIEEQYKEAKRRLNREHDEALSIVFDHFLLRDQQVYYRRAVEVSRTAENQVSLMRVMSLFLAGLALTLSALMTSYPLLLTVLVIIAILSAVTSVLLSGLPDLYQWARLGSVFRSSMENLLVADAQSPPSQIDDDNEYRRMVEQFAAHTMQVMEDETLQWGQLIRPPLCQNGMDNSTQ